MYFRIENILSRASVPVRKASTICRHYISNPGQVVNKESKDLGAKSAPRCYIDFLPIKISFFRSMQTMNPIRAEHEALNQPKTKSCGTDGVIERESAECMKMLPEVAPLVSVALCVSMVGMLGGYSGSKERL